MIVNPNGGNSPRVEVATPIIDVSAGGLITATTEQEKGYVSGGTKSATQQLTVQGAKTVTPTTTNQTAVSSGRYVTGNVTVKGDANLKAENIAEGVSIFGVMGTLAGGQVQIAGIPLDNVSWDSRYVYINLPNPISTLCGLNLLGKYADNLDPEGRNYSVIFVYPAFEITGQSPVWKEGYVQEYTSYYDDWNSQPNNYISYSTDVIRINSNQLRIRSDIASKLVEFYSHTLLYSYIPA